MKKINIFCSDEDFRDRIGPTLLALRADFMVEHLDEDAPEAQGHVHAAVPAPPARIPGPANKPPAMTKEYLETHIPLADRVLEWLRHAPDDTLTKKELRDLALHAGFSPNSINPCVSDLRNAKKVHTTHDGATVVLGRVTGPTPTRYAKRVSELLADILRGRELDRRVLLDLAVAQGIKRSTADTTLSTMLKNTEVIYNAPGMIVLRADLPPVTEVVEDEQEPIQRAVGIPESTFNESMNNV